MNKHTTIRAAVVSVAALLVGCATAWAPLPLYSEVTIDKQSIVPSDDGLGIVARGEVGDSLLVLRINGCADGHGTLEYILLPLHGPIREGVVTWSDSDKWSRLCGERI